jgi:hypothetical protein
LLDAYLAMDADGIGARGAAEGLPARPRHGSERVNRRKRGCYRLSDVFSPSLSDGRLDSAPREDTPDPRHWPSASTARTVAARRSSPTAAGRPASSNVDSTPG